VQSIIELVSVTDGIAQAEASHTFYGALSPLVCLCSLSLSQQLTNLWLSMVMSCHELCHAIIFLEWGLCEHLWALNIV
jgi:hypothetical protein